MRRLESLVVLTLLLTGFPAEGLAADPIFRQALLHECELDLDPADWAALRATFTTNQYYAANLTVDGETIRQVGIRSRGSGSRSGEKPGLKVDINKYVADQEFHGYKILVLDNVIQDPSEMREVLAYAVFEAAGIAAPQIAFCRLTINNEYWGLYTLVEPVSKPLLKARFGEESGTLFDYTYSGEYRFEYRGDDTGAYVPAPFEPQTNQNKIDSGLVEFIRAVSLTPESGYAEAMEAFIDVRRFLTYVAVENACAEDDGMVGRVGLNNFYLYQYGGQQKFVFIPWDKDSSFQTAQWPVQQGMDTNELTRRLMLDPDMKSYYESEVKRIATTFVTTGFLGSRIEQFARMIRAGVAGDEHKLFTLDDFEESVASLLEIVAVRGADVSAQVP